MKPVRMNTIPGGRAMSLVILLCSALLVAACATTEVTAPESTVKERAMARWDALLSGDLSSAYGYLSPATRSSVSSVQYQRSVLLQPVRWTKAEFIEESCEETTCKVMISVDFVIQGALPGVRSISETDVIEEAWLLTDGAWYYVPPK